MLGTLANHNLARNKLACRGTKVIPCFVPRSLRIEASVANRARTAGAKNGQTRMRAWSTLCRSLSRASLVAHTSVSLLFGLGPRCYLALASLAPRIRLLRSRVPAGGGVSSEELSAYGIDCSCYFTDNIYVRAPVEGHFDFHDVARFEQEYTEVLSPPSLSAPVG